MYVKLASEVVKVSEGNKKKNLCLRYQIEHIK